MKRGNLTKSEQIWKKKNKDLPKWGFSQISQPNFVALEGTFVVWCKNIAAS